MSFYVPLHVCVSIVLTSVTGHRHGLPQQAVAAGVARVAAAQAFVGGKGRGWSAAAGVPLRRTVGRHHE